MKPLLSVLALLPIAAACTGGLADLLRFDPRAAVAMESALALVFLAAAVTCGGLQLRQRVADRARRPLLPANELFGPASSRAAPPARSTPSPYR